MPIAHNTTALGRLMDQAEDRVSLCEAFYLCWLLASDTQPDDVRQTRLAAYFAEQPNLAPYKDSLWQMVESGDSDDLLTCCQCLQREIDETRGRRLLARAVRLVSGDQPLDVASNHLLRLLAELLGFAESRLSAWYFKLTGQSLPEPGNPASPQWWRESTRATATAEDFLHYELETLSDRQAREVLGVQDEAGQAEIKQAYRRLINYYHPDRHAAEGVKHASRMFQLVRRAYEVLKS